MTSEEFLAWEAGQELKWEFDGFQPIAMTGVTRAHAVLEGNLLAELIGQLRGGPCRAYGSNLKVKAGSSYHYPDVTVSCTAFADSEMFVENPVVVFEILSSSTAETDKTVKLAEYLALPSVKRYVMLEQTRMFATIVTRSATGLGLALAGPGDRLDIPEIGVSIPMGSLYDGLVLANPEAGR